MLVVDTTKKADDQFILKNQRVSLRATPGTSYEVSEDVLLEGNMVALEKQKYSTKAETHEKSPLNDRLLREMQIDAEKNPANPYALNNLGLAYLNQNSLQDALNCFLKANALKKDFVIASLNLAMTYIRLEREEEALDIYNALLKQDSNDVRILINVGNLNLKQKKFSAARKIYEQIIGIEKSNTLALNQLAMLALIEGKYKDAISYLRQAMKANPASAALNNNLGIAYAASGDLDKALGVLRVALKLAPRYKNAIANLAFVLKQKNQISEGISIIEEYLATNESLSLREFLAGLYVESNNHPKALANLTKILNIVTLDNGSDSEIARLENNIGVVYHHQKNLNNAREHFFRAVQRIGFDNPILLGNIIDLHFDTKKYSEIEKYLNIFRDKYPQNEFSIFYSAKYLYVSGKIDSSQEQFKQFIDKNDSFAPAFVLLGFILSEYYGKYNEAIHIYERGLVKNPKSLLLVNNLAYSYLMTGDIINARRVLERVKDVNNIVCLVATRGLLKIKEGNLEEGSALYNFASSAARNEDFKKSVLIKKNIELARYWNSKGNTKLAAEYASKSVSYRLNESNIYYQQALEINEHMKKLID